MSQIIWTPAYQYSSEDSDREGKPVRSTTRITATGRTYLARTGVSCC